MRIALLHYTQPPVIGGVERVIGDQAAALRTLGHEVEIWTKATMERRRAVGFQEEPRADEPSATPGFLSPQFPITKHRHDLTHWQQDQSLVFLTWRLADSLPADFVEQWKSDCDAWIQENPRPWDAPTEIAYHQRFDAAYLDRLDVGFGSCILRDETCAEAVEQALQYFDGQRYDLISYVIMPNHVHVLVRLRPEWALEKVVQNWKERSAKALNALTSSQGQVWQRGYFDRLIRGPEHLDFVRRYIEQNPVKAGLREGFRLWKADGKEESLKADGSSALHSLMPTDRRRSMGVDAIIVHNVFTMPFDLEWTWELRELAAAMPEIRWISWIHDVASVNPFYAHLPWDQEDHQRLSQPVPNALAVAVSEVRRQDYARASGLPEEEIRMIPNGLDFTTVLGLTERIASLRLWDRELVLMHPTRLLRRKNIELGLQVTASLRDAGCDVLYAITGAPDPHQGDGQVYYQELKALVAGLNLAHHVVFLGETAPLSDADVRSLYCAADALFFPSVGEGFGLPLLEALTHRLAIFCSDLPVHREVVGKEGMYFQIQSKPAEISAQIVQWQRATHVIHQRRHLWQRHDMVKICQEHLEPLLTTANQSS